MPIFCYQSLNASSKQQYGVTFVARQPFTVKAHDHWAGRPPTTPPPGAVAPLPGFEHQSGMLVFPTGLADVAGKHDHSKPTEGPAQLVQTLPEGFVESVNDADFGLALQRKARQTREALFRSMGAMPAVTAIGELKSSHGDFAWIDAIAGAALTPSNQKKACNNFSVFSPDLSKIEKLEEGEGWYAIRYLGIVVVFVHVPNKIADKNLGTVPAQHRVTGHIAKKAKTAAHTPANDPELVMFYRGIHNTLRNKLATVDVIMGDTNQKSHTVTPEAVSWATNMKFENARAPGRFFPIDTYEIDTGGTNSMQDQPYDVVVYNPSRVTVGKVRYFTQQAPFDSGGTRGVASVTDHMGMAVEVKLRIAQP